LSAAKAGATPPKAARKPSRKRKASKAKVTGKKAPAATAPKTAVPPPSQLTQPLGLEGWAALEPVILAALASAEPLLLVGRHGAAKSFLLERLAEALRLEYRFYNASLIDYDDLVGIPVPDADSKGLHYISTPTSIWGAEVVFVDEISRTRPDLANKLFPIIHERRVQGIDLKSLRHRWAAMNPPSPEDDDGSDELQYLGVEPLDPALADRFAFLVEVPDWHDLTGAEQVRLLADQFRGKHDFPVDISALVRDAERAYALLCEEFPQRLAAYFQALGTVRASAKLQPFSTRRMATLVRTTLALQAARVALARGADPLANPRDVDWASSVWLAVRHGDPELASVGRLDRARQLALHRQAWTLSGLQDDDPWRALLEVNDPLERVARAFRLGGGFSPEDIGRLVLDALSSQQNEALRTATALALYLGAHRIAGLPAVVTETLARDVRRVLRPVQRRLTVPSHNISPARAVAQIAASLRQKGDSSGALCDLYTRNLLEALLPDGYSGTAPIAVHGLFVTLWQRFDLGTRIGAAS
jgi:MoxR-like ATPase